MIKERYCSYEVCTLLKECGFNEYCKKSYSKLNEQLEDSATSDWGKANQLYAPTHQMVLDWLNEKYGLFIALDIGEDADGELGYIADILNTHDLKTDGSGKFSCVASADDIYTNGTPTDIYNAIEIAVKYALENIVDNDGLTQFYEVSPSKVSYEVSPSKVSIVVCLKCFKRWVAVRPVGTRLTDLECPQCHEQGFAIETGEDIEQYGKLHDM